VCGIFGKNLDDSHQFYSLVTCVFCVIGTYNKNWGGIPLEEIIQAIQSSKILIPEITVVPTAVIENEDTPPELEIRFDMELATVNDPPDSDLPPLPVNWQLRFIQNQLFRLFQNPSRFCPGSFHSTILRKAEFRSEEHKNQYFDKCKLVVDRWNLDGPKPLLIPDTTKMNLNANIERIRCPIKKVTGGQIGSSPEYVSGLWLFTDRNHITHLFEPNFLPPYDTPAKRKLILDVLSEVWDETTLSWKPYTIPIESMAYEVQKEIVNKPKQDFVFFGGFDSFFETLCGPIPTAQIPADYRIGNV
jgi:hypothetical protein